MNKRYLYHGAAIFCIIAWGASAACTKVLLEGFTAVHILFLKYLLGYLTVVALCPKPLRAKSRRDELLLFLCGLSGMTLCYLFENIALIFTSSATVGVMFNASPIFVMLFQVLIGRKKSGMLFWGGCAVCVLGAWLVAFNGFGFVGGNVQGIVLALLAAVAWAAYVLLSEKLNESGYELKESMRRIFFYGVLTQIPLLLWEHESVALSFVLQPTVLLLILYMGVLAAAISYVLWNLCIMRLGGVQTNVYMYLLPFFTMAISALTIHESIGLWQWIGAALTIVGVVVTQQDKRAAENPAPEKRPMRVSQMAESIR